MSEASRRQGVKASELFRERVVARHHGAITDLVIPEPGVDVTASPQGYVPRSSKDTALTAFAQLAALRLDCSRALISLIDASHQYILAESTRTLSLQSDVRHSEQDSLWLGSVVIPRGSGLCGLALEHAVKAQVPSDSFEGDDLMIIEDMRDHERCGSAPFVLSGPQLRFYCGVPIRNSDGAVLGIFCVFDDKPRCDLTGDQILFLHDMAKTTAEHLEAVRLRSAHIRTTKLVTGLDSFVDGLKNTRSTEEASGNRTAPLAENPRELAVQDVSDEDRTPQTQAHASITSPGTPAVDAQDLAPKGLWDIAMPPGSKQMFQRAANIMRQAGDYEGVVFFYMPSGHKAQSRRPRSKHGGSVSNSRRPSADSASGSLAVQIDGNDDTEDNGGTSDTEGSSGSGVDQPLPKDPCAVLSYSLSDDEIVPTRFGPFPRFKQADMETLTGRSPRARTVTLNRSGELLPGDTSSSGSGLEQDSAPKAYGGPDSGPEKSDVTARQLRLVKRQVKSLKKLSSTALAYSCLPLWDFERQRWLAYCICWTSSPARHLKQDGDLAFQKIFANSIAIALSHIDAIASNQAKSTFVSSISHELRSPLHGILSASNFLKDPKLTRFQTEMVEVISSCGRTLLDTVDHIFDFAKISSLGPKHGRTTSANPGLTPTMQSSSSAPDSALSSNVDLSILIEEVVEAVLMGFNVQHDFVYSDDDPRSSLARMPSYKSSATSLATSRRTVDSRGRIRLALQLPYRQNWVVNSPSGAWRRVIMNLFGNSLKYTEDGLITVRVEPHSWTTSALPLCLEVLDSGKGMSQAYMDAHLYTAFSQEDEFSSGTGLGLSIVKQIIDALGGKIDIKSTRGVGTSVRVDLTVPLAAPTPSDIDSPSTVQVVADRLRGQRVFVIQDFQVAAGQCSEKAEGEFSEAVFETLRDWFGVQAVLVDSWPSEPADLVICLKPLLKYFQPTARDQIADQPVVIVTYDALEMAVLRADARITREDAVIEIMSQPLGPHKLARSLEQCLDRQSQLLARKERAESPSATHENHLPILNNLKLGSPSPTTSPFPGRSRRVSAELCRDPFVLIVDDNAVNLRLLSVFVKKQSFVHHEAVNGQEAVDIFRIARSWVRCILMDISMPAMDGITATRHIRQIEKEEKLPRTPIIALTGLTSAAARMEATEAGMNEFFTKPLSYGQLGSFLRQIEGL